MKSYMSVTFELRIKHGKVTNVIIGDPDIAVNSEDTCNTRQSVVLSCDTVISSTALTATLHQRDQKCRLLIAWLPSKLRARRITPIACLYNPMTLTENEKALGGDANTARWL